MEQNRPDSFGQLSFAVVDLIPPEETDGVTLKWIIVTPDATLTQRTWGKFVNGRDAKTASDALNQLAKLFLPEKPMLIPPPNLLPSAKAIRPHQPGATQSGYQEPIQPGTSDTDQDDTQPES